MSEHVLCVHCEKHWTGCDCEMYSPGVFVFTGETLVQVNEEEN